MFVVGTVLYRNLGSFLALQRWAPWAQGRRGARGAGCWGLPDTLTRLLALPRNTTVLNSKVISVTVKPPPRSLLTPLEIEFAHMHNVSVCARTAACARRPPDPACACVCAGVLTLLGRHLSLARALLSSPGDRRVS